MPDFIAQLLPGVAAMANIHPLVAHFPIALLTSFLALELFAMFSRNAGKLRIAASWMLYLGTLGACAAVAAGLWAEATVVHDEAVHAIIEKHETMGFTVLSLAILLSVWRLIGEGHFSGIGRIAHLLLAFVMVVAMAKGADLGGLMVYQYGVGTQAAEENEGHHHGGEGLHEHGAAAGHREEANRLHFHF